MDHGPIITPNAEGRCDYCGSDVRTPVPHTLQACREYLRAALNATMRSLQAAHHALDYVTRLIDGVGDIDLHEEAFAVLERRDPAAAARGDDPSDEDYREAFCRAVARASAAEETDADP